MTTVDRVTEAQQTEIDALRARNAKLERPTVGQRSRSALRATAVVVLLTLGALLVTVAVPAIWARNLVLNTDRYVQTMAPLASDPGLQAGVVKAIDKQFNDNVDIEALAKDVLPSKAGILAGPLESAAQGLVNTVATRFVESAAFVTIWKDMNRIAHKEIVAVLTGKGGSDTAVSIRNNTVTLNLAPVITAVKTQLVSSGLSVASKVPVVGATIQIAHVKGVDKARSLVSLLNKAAWWLPLLGLVLLVAGVLISRHRRRSTIIAALSVAGGMLVIAIGLVIGRNLYLNALPGVYLSRSAASGLFDTLVRFLRDGLRIVVGVALLICLIAWLTGPSKPATGLRRIPTKATRAWAGSPAARGLAGNRGLAAGIVFGVAALILVVWNQPSLTVVVVIGIVTLLLLLLVYLVKDTAASEPAAAAGVAPSG